MSAKCGAGIPNPAAGPEAPRQAPAACPGAQAHGLCPEAEANGPAQHIVAFSWGQGTFDGTPAGPLQKLFLALATKLVSSTQHLSVALPLVCLL